MRSVGGGSCSRGYDELLLVDKTFPEANLQHMWFIN